MTAYPIFDGALELRQSGGARTLHGRFNYNSMATIRDRGRVRKERFEPRAFRFAIEDETRQLDILVGQRLRQADRQPQGRNALNRGRRRRRYLRGKASR